MLRKIEASQLVLGTFLIWAFFSFLSNSLLALHHVAIVALIVLLNKKLFAKEPRSAWALFAFFLFAVLSVLVNWPELLHPWNNLAKCKYTFFTTALALAAYRGRDELQKNLGSLFSIFSLSFLAANLYGISKWIYQCYFTVGIIDRLGGFFGMILGYSYAAVFPILFLSTLLLFPVFREKLQKNATWPKLRFAFDVKFLYFSLALAVIAMFLSQTRGEFIGVLCGAPFLLYFKSPRAFWKTLFVSALFIGAVFLYTLKYGSQTTRLLQPVDSKNHGQRIAQVEVGIKAFEEKPFFGIGFRSFEERDPGIKAKYDLPHKDFVGHAHNNFVETLATTGICGFLALLLWLGLWIAEVFSIDAVPWKSFYVASIVAFIITGFTQATFNSSECEFTIFALYALSSVAQAVPADLFASAAKRS